MSTPIHYLHTVAEAPGKLESPKANIQWGKLILCYWWLLGLLLFRNFNLVVILLLAFEPVYFLTIYLMKWACIFLNHSNHVHLFTVFPNNINISSFIFCFHLSKDLREDDEYKILSATICFQTKLCWWCKEFFQIPKHMRYKDLISSQPLWAKKYEFFLSKWI